MWKKTGDPVDGAPLYIGVQTFLRQFHPDIITQYLEYLADYIKSIISHCIKYVFFRFCYMLSQHVFLVKGTIAVYKRMVLAYCLKRN